jgi:hypothetical protein
MSPLFSVTITAPTIAELRQKLLDALDAAGPVTSASAKNSAPTVKPEPMWHPSIRAEPEFVDEPKPQVQDVLSETSINIDVTDDPLAKAPPDAVAEAVAQMAQEEAKRPRGRPAKHANGNGKSQASAAPKPVKLPKNLDKPAVLKVLERYLAAHGEASTLELLQTHGSGAQRLSAVDPADYPAVYNAIMQGL